MTSAQHSTNHLLQALPAAEREVLRPHSASSNWSGKLSWLKPAHR